MFYVFVASPNPPIARNDDILPWAEAKKILHFNKIFFFWCGPVFRPVLENPKCAVGFHNLEEWRPKLCYHQNREIWLLAFALYVCHLGNGMAFQQVRVVCAIDYLIPFSAATVALHSQSFGKAVWW